MDLQLKDKVIIVTGGGRGIGGQIVKNLASEGAIPCIIDRNVEAAAKLITELQEKGNTFFHVVADLLDEQACEKAVDEIKKKFGRIDGLVNNAGLNDGVGLENGSYEGFVSSLENNVGHYYLMARLTLESLKTSKGSIVNICSKVALTGQGGTSGYAAANGVRVGLTAEWAHELFHYGIRVNGVVVAECFTPQYEWWINQQTNAAEKLNEIKSKIPLGNRMTTPEEIANATVFLLSAESAPINGELFYVDGGYVHLDRRA